MKPQALRKWHTVIGLIGVIPLVVFGITGVLLIHDDAFGLEDISVNAGWHPEHQQRHRHQQRHSPSSPLPTLKAILPLENGHTLVGTDKGLMDVMSGHSQRIQDVPDVTVHSIQKADEKVLVCTKEGAWAFEDTIWHPIYKGECWDIREKDDEEGLQLVSNDKGILNSQDNGAHWTPDTVINQSLQSVLGAPDTKEHHTAEHGTTLKRLALDIHTGRALLGKEWRWLWVDTIASLLLLISLSGIWIWARTCQKSRG